MPIVAKLEREQRKERMMKAYLQTKAGEIEGQIEFNYGGTGLCDFIFVSSQGVSGVQSKLETSDFYFRSETAAHAHFEKHFGRIIREDG